MKTMPFALQGQTKGLSLLFPMEQLFEQHVATCLRKVLDAGCSILTPATGKYLCRFADQPMFRLEPDILVACGKQAWVLDTKWKLLDEANREGKFGLSQADFYQLYASGQKYLGGVGELALIYPKTAAFFKALSPFSFSPQMRLHVLPFDLDNDVLIGHDAVGLPLRMRRCSTAA
jgi:5-methylcytosine-specific restriction enzyme subunit McrC